MTDQLSVDGTAERAAAGAESTPPQRPAGIGRFRNRRWCLIGWSVLFVAAFLAFGLPTDPGYAFFWLWAFTVAWRIDQPWRSHLLFLRDWIPVIILLTIYNLSRGFANGIREPHVTELIHADEWMFGWATGGTVPTVWLQQNLYDPARVQWWEVVVTYVYFSHFVVALAAAIVLWLTSRPRWAAFMRRWFVLSLSGLITYFLYPAAPPWWAAVHQYLEPVERLSLRGGQEFGMHGAFSLIRLGQLAANPVAAIPSLHTAFALFVVLFFLRNVRRRWWPLLLLYPLAMTFTLVYSGEHYVIDVLVGWAYVVGVFLITGWAERWWRNWRSRRRAGSDADRSPTGNASPALAEAPPGRHLDAG
ncbi:inositol phosphorylceramide synthase [Micromonospora craterilacus]|uniref:Inositol phosphorylceramide synthase n=1 Tax=Micromonospora craterilacus TaxID=1655439 RepID=A0A2W2EEY4_9ACTN|nr:phosphatase PAP2 family protein [Micromonospora craterilacus]PZG22896.1 inositol phosphorylceramide synthase [Micromonospora craterilacus]